MCAPYRAEWAMPKTAGNYAAGLLPDKLAKEKG